jgi:chromosome segregation ATPase
MIDIVKRLEATNHQVALDAADIIKQLRAQLRERAEEVERLRKELENWRETADNLDEEIRILESK